MQIAFKCEFNEPTVSGCAAEVALMKQVSLVPNDQTMNCPQTLLQKIDAPQLVRASN